MINISTMCGYPSNDFGFVAAAAPKEIPDKRMKKKTSKLLAFNLFGIFFFFVYLSSILVQTRIEY
ncbi:hypothetical protein DERP_005339 [Dermatophagoides pteronyssinus]|uniref:Uncharacterized protein n=1 Tax=Dermatophagoides pteronyssinus TaxID=6956 RepID=A0ABQ8JMB0_DERPT|nr:hypothetical protein DERP_005339 [Dermatophagoides pteronyssinus]